LPGSFVPEVLIGVLDLAPVCPALRTLPDGLMPWPVLSPNPSLGGVPCIEVCARNLFESRRI
jgi:hypothetical protein